jgi:hypothetical protein
MTRSCGAILLSVRFGPLIFATISPHDARIRPIFEPGFASRSQVGPNRLREIARAVPLHAE